MMETTLPDQSTWKTVSSWTAAIIVAIFFLAAGLWKITDPQGAAVKLAQAKVPESLSLAGAVAFGIAETLAGVMLLVPMFRRWGAIITSLLLCAFMIFIGIHYTELRGADCSCFPWLKRAVGPGFFAGDGALLALAIVAGVWGRASSGFRSALAVLAAVAVFAGVSFGISSTRHTGTRAPAALTAMDGRSIPIGEGKVFVYFFNPQCMHCLEAGRKLAALKWGDTKFIGIPTENPQFGGWFMGKAGLTGMGPVAKEFEAMKKLFPFDLPPAGVAIENGYSKAILLQFEDKEPAATLARLGFTH